VATERTRAPTGRQSTAALAAERIRRRILDERVPAGTRLGSQDQLVADLGLSWGSGREMLRLLTEQGLITSRPGPAGGVYVSSPQSETVITAVANYLSFRGLTPTKLHVARQAVEPPLAGLAALEGAHNGELLTPVMAQADDLLRRRLIDDAAWSEVAVRFHVAIVACSPGHPLALFAEALLELASSEGRQLSAESAEPASRVLARRRENHEQHMAIADAIARGAQQQAEDLMRRHLEFTQMTVAELNASRRSRKRSQKLDNVYIEK
jgi:GntR family transcriptional repressor for pyruvate dehydrogenase complex